MLDLKTLQTLEVIAREGSFTKAAAALNVSQPALTKRIARLEDELCVELFLRANNGVSVTDYGRHLIERSRAIIASVTGLEREITLMAGLERGTLLVGVGPVVEQMFLPDIMAAFSQRYPKIAIRMVVGSAQTLIGSLREGQLDVVIAASLGQDTETGLVVETLVSEDVVFVGRAGHPLLVAAPSRVTMDDVMGYPFALPMLPPPLRRQIEAHGNKPLELHLQCENYGVLVSVVLRTDYVSGGPASLFADAISRGELVALPVTERIIWGCQLLTRQDFAASRLISAFADIVRSCIVSRG